MQGQIRVSASDYNHIPFLSASQLSQRLLQYEQEFADRYSKRDDYYRYANRVKKAPVPVIKPWPPASYTKHFNYRKEAVLHRHRNSQRENRNRAPHHRSVHARLGRFTKTGHGQTRAAPLPSVSSPSPAPPGGTPDSSLSQGLPGEPEIELEVSCVDEAGRDQTEDSSSDEGGTHGNAVPAPSPLSQYSFSSHENPQPSLSPPCDLPARSPFSPGTGTGSDTPGDSKVFPPRTSPSRSGSFTPDTPTPFPPLPGPRAEQQGPKRVNLANLSAIQGANGHKLKKPARSNSGNLFSNILASNDYSLDRPKPFFPEAREQMPPPPSKPDPPAPQLDPVAHLPSPSEDPGPLLISLPLDRVRASGQKGRSTGKSGKKEPIAPVKIKLTGKTWQLESCLNNPTPLTPDLALGSELPLTIAENSQLVS